MQFYVFQYFLDLAAFVALTTATMLLLSRWLRQRTGKSLSLRSWSLLLFVMVSTIAMALFFEQKERSRLVRTISGLAPTYASEMARLGLEKISPDTPANDPTYLALINAQVRWEKANPGIADIYTLARTPAGKTVLLVDSETDYDHNGAFEGDREQRTAIGEEFDEDELLVQRAFNGEEVFAPTPVRDRWGNWIGAYSPVKNDAGQVFAVLGVDYPADDWIETLLVARGSMLGLGELLAIILMASLTVTTTLKAEVARREILHQQLIDASRRAGMAEIATGVLHNVGNALNSVNVSAGVISEKLGGGEVAELAQASTLLKDHSADLPHYLTNDSVGRHLPAYFTAIARAMLDRQNAVGQEMEQLTRGIEHIKEIVRSQQEHSKSTVVTAPASPRVIFEEALAMALPSTDRTSLEITTDFQSLPELPLDRHKLLQILVNLLRNAARAVQQTPPGTTRRITLRLARNDGQLLWQVVDTGVGVSPENLTRIFQHGFTTHHDGHGFGLHSASNAAAEMGGTLTATSDGPGRGAAFTLALPLQRLPQEALP